MTGCTLQPPRDLTTAEYIDAEHIAADHIDAEHIAADFSTADRIAQSRDSQTGRTGTHRLLRQNHAPADADISAANRHCSR